MIYSLKLWNGGSSNVAFDVMQRTDQPWSTHIYLPLQAWRNGLKFPPKIVQTIEMYASELESMS